MTFPISKHKKLLHELSVATREESVKRIIANIWNIKYDVRDNHDLYTPQALFEFKYDENMKNIPKLSKILAQTMYYIRDIKYGNTEKSIPPYIVLVDKNECAISDTSIWKEYYDSEKYDWKVSPSTPDIQLVTDIARDDMTRQIHVHDILEYTDFCIFYDKLSYILDIQTTLALGSDKKKITEENFETVYAHWKKEIFEHTESDIKFSSFFVCDIQPHKTTLSPTGDLFFNLWENKTERLQVQPQRYMYFWELYEKISDARTLKNIISKVDRLSDDIARRRKWEFFTPIAFASVGLQYIADTLGKNWYYEYKIWDMACGTWNLERNIPADAYQNLYMSTLDTEDVDYCRRIFPGATVWQYDYLNDDVDAVYTPTGQTHIDTHTWKLPQSLRTALADTSNKWIILINPPFATSTSYGWESKADVSNTKVRTYMGDSLGKASQELFAQFYHRIHTEMPVHTYMGIYSKLKYVNSGDFEVFREKIFDYTYQRGFIFSSQNFQGTNGQFPVGFLFWDTSVHTPIHTQDIQVDIVDNSTRRIGTKTWQTGISSGFLSKWIPRPKCSIPTVPYSSGVTIYGTNGAKIALDKMSENAIWYMYCGGNDFQTAPTQTAIFSGVYGNGHGICIEPDIYEQCMVVYAVRRIPPATWINDRDQFLAPSISLPGIYMTDCVIWSLFSGSNQSVSMRDVVYAGSTYQIANEFFPYTIDEIQGWECSDPEVYMSATSDRYSATYLQTHVCSPLAQAVLDAGRAVYREFYRQYVHLDKAKYKIQSWDAGWYQIRNSLVDAGYATEELSRLKITHTALGQDILPRIYEYGFLAPEHIVV